MEIVFFIILGVGILLGVFCIYDVCSGEDKSGIMAYLFKYPAIVLTVIGLLGVYFAK